MKTDPIKYDVFISCKSEDYPEAIAIHKYLVEQGLRVFLADVELRKKGRDVYGEIIDGALESADHMIVFTSKAAYVNSTYVKSEWRTFVEEKRSGRKKGNIVTILKGVQVADLPIALRSVQYFLYKDYESVIDYLPVLSKQKSTSTPTLTSTPKKPYPNYLWALALMPLVLIGLWLGIDSYQEKQAVLREQQAQELAEAIAEGKGRDGVYQVGDYYNRNGKQGIVFEVSADGRHGKIVSLNQTGAQWCSDEEYNRKIETGASDKTTGMNNQRKIQQISGWREKYPAFAYCADQGEGWYLPAIEELKQFTLNDTVHDAVNRTLQAKGGTKLFDKGDYGKTYWSSTESDYKAHIGWMYCAWYVSMSYGNTNRSLKDSNGYVRAVSAF